MCMRSAFRVFISGLLLCLSCVWVQAQDTGKGQRQSLRQSVCVVYPEFTPEDSVLLCKYAMMLVREGKSPEARQTRNRVRGAFGSGVVTDRCVLTNRHVVCYARTAKLVFEYEIWDEEGVTLFVKGRSVQVFMDMNYQLIWTNPPFFEEWKKKWL